MSDDVKRPQAMWVARSQLYERNSDAMKVEGDATAVVPVAALAGCGDLVRPRSAMGCHP